MQQSYTHMDFFQDVREMVAQKLTGKDADAVRAAEIVYLCHPTEETSIRNFFHVLEAGHDATARAETIVYDKPDRPALVQIYASGEGPRRMLAFTLIHELGHVIAGQSPKDDGHGPYWASIVRSLGIDGGAYVGDVAPIENPNGVNDEEWLDKNLLASVDALPPFTDFEALRDRMQAEGFRYMGPGANETPEL